MGVLTVTVVKATHLADEDLIGKTDPYVKLCKLFVQLRLNQYCVVYYRVMPCNAMPCCVDASNVRYPSNSMFVLTNRIDFFL